LKNIGNEKKKEKKRKRIANVLDWIYTNGILLFHLEVFENVLDWAKVREESAGNNGRGYKNVKRNMNQPTCQPSCDEIKVGAQKMKSSFKMKVLIKWL